MRTYGPKIWYYGGMVLSGGMLFRILWLHFVPEWIHDIKLTYLLQVVLLFIAFTVWNHKLDKTQVRGILKLIYLLIKYTLYLLLAFYLMLIIPGLILHLGGWDDL